MSKVVKGLFGGTAKPPKVIEPPPPPSVDDAAAAKDAADDVLRRKGRAASILTGPSGAGAPKTAAKTLLGG